MGYITQFSGVLRFNEDMSVSQLRDLNKFMGEDCRDHPEWEGGDLSYIDLRITKDMSGIEWDESEKTYDLVEKVNLILSIMRRKYPDFRLEGELLAQGEDPQDRWVLKMERGNAVRRELRTYCPHCGTEL